MQRSTRSLNGRLASCAALIGVLLFSQPAEAAVARSVGQPISAYSASLFGKKNLSAAQTQTLTADPDEPLGGSTSGAFDPTIVQVTGYGYGPGYETPPVPSASPFRTGFGIEVKDLDSPNGFVLMDLDDYLGNPSAYLPSGYFRVWFAIGDAGVSATGKLTDDPTFLANHPGYIPLDNDGPLGVDTHYLDFQYLDTDDRVPAKYSIFAEDPEKHYILGPSGFQALNSDFVITQDSPREEIRPGGSVPFVPANVIGTVPEPAATAAWLALLVGAARRRRHLH
jgi:hypothetical protein